MLVVLDSLTPAERVAFVLHDVFARAVRRDRARSSAGRRRRRGSSRAVPVAASRARPCPTSTSMANGPSSTRSSRRRATATSSACSPSSTRTSCCAPTAGRRVRAWSRWSAAREAVAAQAMTFRRFAETATRVLVNGIPGGVAWAPDGSPFAVLALTVRGGQDRRDRRARGSGPARRSWISTVVAG